MKPKEFIFDFDGTLKDSSTVQKIFLYLIEKNQRVSILTSRISGLEQPDYLNWDNRDEDSQKISVEKLWNNRYGIPYINLNHYSDIYELLEFLNVGDIEVNFTEGCSKAYHLKRELVENFVIFDDSEDEIKYLKELYPQEVIIQVDRCKDTFEYYENLIKEYI